MKSLNIKTSTGSVLRSTMTVKQAVHDNYGCAFLCESDGLHSVTYFFKECKKRGLKPVVGVEIVFDITNPSKKACVFAKHVHGYSDLVKLVSSCQYDEEIGLVFNGNLKVYSGLVIFTAEYIPLEVSYTTEVYWGYPISPVTMEYGSKEECDILNILTAIRYKSTVGSGDVPKIDDQGYFNDIRVPYELEDHFLFEILPRFEIYDLPVSKDPIPKSGIAEDEFSVDLDGRLTKYLVEVVDFEKYNEYRERLDYELKTINGFGYKDYFVMVEDIIKHCNEHLSGYYSAGRGSVGGSLVAFLLGITRIDPVNPPGFDMGIPFDRFLNSGRKTLPDIDLDFCPKDRPYIVEYLRFKYGVDHVMNIGTVNTLASRSALKDVAKALNMLTPDIENIIKSFPSDQTLTLELVEKSDIYASNKHNTSFVELFKVAKQLEGMPRSRGVHASGIAVSTRPFTGFIPISVTERVDVLQYDNDSLDAVGVVKFDILGLNNLQNISLALKHVGMTLEDLNKIPLDDQKTIDLINNGPLSGVFQWDTYNYKKVIEDLKPNSFKELVDLNTLGRSAALLSGLTDSYIKRKRGVEAVEPIHPSLAGLMKQTYELPLYQEQIMLLFVSLADYTMSEADDVRKAIGKKIPELMEQQKNKFAERCLAKGLTQSEVDGIWEKIDKFSKYTWNLGHAAAYTRVCYETAYLASHYPAEYYSACASNSKKSDEAYGFVTTMKRVGVDIYPADINKSGLELELVPGGVRLGLGGIKRVGDSAIECIFSSREHGEFKSIKEFFKRTKGRAVNVGTLKSLYTSGAFDLLPDILEFGSIVGISEDEALFLRVNQYLISSRIVVDPRIFFPDSMPLADMHPTTVCMAYVISIKEIYTKSKGELMAFLKVEDGTGCFEAVAFPAVWKNSQGIKGGMAVKLVVEFQTDKSLFVKFIREVKPEDIGKELM